ncbi:MAG: hypothetical protein ACK559_00725, partial [bacterium]
TRACRCVRDGSQRAPSDARQPAMPTIPPTARTPAHHDHRPDRAPVGPLPRLSRGVRRQRPLRSRRW